MNGSLRRSDRTIGAATSRDIASGKASLEGAVGNEHFARLTAIVIHRQAVSIRIRDLNERLVAVKAPARIEGEADVLQHHRLRDLFRVLPGPSENIFVEGIEGVEGDRSIPMPVSPDRMAGV
jgi:hypothetical protein